jgi:hypothetical protein
MTEPNDEPVVEPSATAPVPPEFAVPPESALPPESAVPPKSALPPESAPAPEAMPPDPALPPIPDGQPPVPPAPAWIPPDGGGGGGGARRGCCLVVAVVGALGAILVVVALVALIFLGSQIRELQGTVRYETGTDTTCFVKTPATTFPASSTIHFVATFNRPVAATENISVVVTFPDGTSRTTDSAYQGGGICVSDTLDPGLEVGSWALEFRSGAEVLATGGFAITP